MALGASLHNISLSQFFFSELAYRPPKRLDLLVSSDLGLTPSKASLNLWRRDNRLALNTLLKKGNYLLYDFCCDLSTFVSISDLLPNYCIISIFKYPIRLKSLKQQVVFKVQSYKPCTNGCYYLCEWH